MSFGTSSPPAVRFAVIARDKSKLPSEVRARAEVIEGSHGDAAVIDQALDGANALFWLAPPDPTHTLDEVYLDFTRPAADAIRRSGVARGRFCHRARPGHSVARSGWSGHRVHPQWTTC